MWVTHLVRLNHANLRKMQKGIKIHTKLADHTNFDIPIVFGSNFIPDAFRIFVGIVQIDTYNNGSQELGNGNLFILYSL